MQEEDRKDKTETKEADHITTGLRRGRRVWDPGSRDEERAAVPRAYLLLNL